MTGRKKQLRKLRRRGGFTLAETLVTVLLLLMVSSIVAAGIPVARNVYEKVLVSANAEVLLSTSVSALRSELGTAREITVSDGKTITYFSADTGSYSRIYPDSSGGGQGVLMLQEYIGFPEAHGGAPAGSPAPLTRQLITDKAATGDLYITYQSAEVSDDGIIKIHGLSVRRKSAPAEAVTETDLLSVRTINM